MADKDQTSHHKDTMDMKGKDTEDNGQSSYGKNGDPVPDSTEASMSGKEKRRSQTKRKTGTKGPATTTQSVSSENEGNVEGNNSEPQGRSPDKDTKHMSNMKDSIGGGQQGKADAGVELQGNGSDVLNTPAKDRAEEDVCSGSMQNQPQVAAAEQTQHSLAWLNPFPHTGSTGKNGQPFVFGVWKTGCQEAEMFKQHSEESVVKNVEEHHEGYDKGVRTPENLSVPSVSSFSYPPPPGNTRPMMQPRIIPGNSPMPGQRSSQNARSGIHTGTRFKRPQQNIDHENIQQQHSPSSQIGNAQRQSKGEATSLTQDTANLWQGRQLSPAVSGDVSGHSSSPGTATSERNTSTGSNLHFQDNNASEVSSEMKAGALPEQLGIGKVQEENQDFKETQNTPESHLSGSSNHDNQDGPVSGASTAHLSSAQSSGFIGITAGDSRSQSNNQSISQSPTTDAGHDDLEFQGGQVSHLEQENQQLKEELLRRETDFSDELQSLQSTIILLEEQSMQLKDEFDRKEKEFSEKLRQMEDFNTQLRDKNVQLRDEFGRKVKEFSDKLQEMKDSNTQLKDEFGRKEKEFSDKLQEMKDSNTQLKDEFGRKEKEFSDKLQEMKDSNTQLKDGYGRKEKEFSEKLQQMKDFNTQLQDGYGRKEKEFSDKLQEMKDSNTQLRDENVQLTGQLDTISSELKKKEEHCSILMTAIKVHINEKEKADAERTAMADQFQTLQAEIQGLQERATLSHKKAVMCQTVVAFQTFVSQSYRSKFGEMENHNQMMSTKLGEVQNVRHAQQINLTDALNQVQSLEATLSAEKEKHEAAATQLKGRIFDLNNEVEQLQADISHLTEERDEIMQDCDRQTAEIEELHVQKEQWDQERAKLTEQMEPIRRERDELAMDCEVLKGQKEVAEGRAVAFGQELTTAQVHIANFQTFTSEKERQYNNTIAEYTSRVETLTAEARKREEQVLPLEIAAKRAIHEVEHMRKQLDDMKTSKEREEQKVSDLRAEIVRAESALQESRRNETKLMEDMNDLRTQNGRYIRETRAARDQIRILQAEVKRLSLRQ